MQERVFTTLDNPFVALALLFVLGVILIALSWLQRTQAGDVVPLVSAPHPHTPTSTPPPAAPAPAPPADAAYPTAALFRPTARLHTIITGSTGDGKTQTQLALLVGDVMAGACVYWCSPHATLFNAADQPTDLRPLREHVVLVHDYAGIGAVLRAARELVDARMSAYRANWPQGKPAPVVLHLDEYPAINERCPNAESDIRAILREGRKVGVLIVLATQDAEVETLGLKSGVRELFRTRLIGNVASPTWLALVGKGYPRTGVAAGSGLWQIPWGQRAPQAVEITRPTAAFIAHLAAQHPVPTRVLVVPTTPSDAERRSDPRSALECDVSPRSTVPEVADLTEIVLIVRELERGTAPSEIAKRLPGYTARAYKAYRARVDQIAAAHAQSVPLPLPDEDAPAL